MQRGITNMRAYLVNHGFSDSQARNLLSGRTKEPSFKTWIRLCGTFNCTLDALVDWHGDPNHPLARLKKEPAPDLRQLFEGKSPAEVLEMLKRMEEGKNGDGKAEG